MKGKRVSVCMRDRRSDDALLRHSQPLSALLCGDRVFIQNQKGIDTLHMGYFVIIVIRFYSPSCLVQETAKGPFGLRVKLPPAHLSTTHGGGFTLSL